MDEEVPLRDVVSREFVGVGATDSLSAAARMLADSGADAAVVLGDDGPAGVVDRAAVIEAVAAGHDPETVPVETVMNEDPPTFGPVDAVGDVVDTVLGTEGRGIVVDEDTVVGTVGADDLLAASVASPPDGAEPVTEGPDRSEFNPGRRPGESNSPFDRQGVCEECGTFSRALTNREGQLICTDCHAGD